MRHATQAFLLALLTVTSGCGKGVMTSPNAAATGLQSTSLQAGNAARFVNRVVVRYKSGTSDSQIRAFHQRYNLRSLREVSALRMGVLGLPTGSSDSEVMSRIQSNPAVDYVEPDFVFTLPKRQAKRAPRAAARKLMALGFSVDDPRAAEQWGMTKIGMNKVWPINAGNAGITVAVIDTGVDVRHPDLQNALVPGYSVLANSPGPDDDHGHGTHVAGVIAASVNNRQGIAGMAPHCRIMPVKVLNFEGKGDTGDIVTGLLWAVNNGAKVVNMSLGGTGGSRALMSAVQYALSKDVVLVAAMGNDGKNSQEYPAGYPGVIAVGATDEDDKIADFSNYGTWISVSAPGYDILSTLPTRAVTVVREEGKEMGYDFMDGTSMAAPFVAGLSALVRSQFPTLTAAQVKTRIEKTADDMGDRGPDDHFGSGRINAARAVLGQ